MSSNSNLNQGDESVAKTATRVPANSSTQDERSPESSLEWVEQLIQTSESEEDVCRETNRQEPAARLSAPEAEESHSSSGSRRDDFATSVALLAILTVVQKGLGFVRSIVICQNLPPDQLGLWSMTLTFLETIVPVLILSIPACFGRYFERFEQQGQLKAFIRQSLIIMLASFALGIVAIHLLRERLALLFFGDTAFVSMLDVALIVMIPFGSFGILASMLTGFRKSQSRSIGEFITGISFTGLAVTLVMLGYANAYFIVFAFAGSYVLASTFALFRVRAVYNQLEAKDSLIWKGTWPPLLPAIAIFWLSDFLTNLFFTVDRFMIVNFSPKAFGESLVQVGNYESAHVFPILLMSFMAIVSRMLLPYLAKDWEAGKYQAVSHKVNLSVKLSGLLLIVGATLLLWCSGFLFQTLFQGKYSDGLQIFPLILFFYVGSGISFMLLNYFWCCEKGRFAILALIAGLIANTVVNTLLLPHLGIQGAAMGTAVAVSIQLTVLWVAALYQGLQFSWYIPVLLLGAGSILISPLIATFVGIALSLLLFCRDALSRSEWAILMRIDPAASKAAK